MTQNFGFTAVLETQAHSGLRNCFSDAIVESKDKSDSGIIELSSLSINKFKLFSHTSLLRLTY
ncbi:MAG: hypothetical protein GQ581_00325 [Methyloprofundus sp.]|nr:hypothetical protein [Methyloprofundus sp.]